MAKLKDGFYKQTAEAIGSDLYVLLAGGGMKPLADFANASSVDYAAKAGDSDKLGGLPASWYVKVQSLSDSSSKLLSNKVWSVGSTNKGDDSTQNECPTYYGMYLSLQYDTAKNQGYQFYGNTASSTPTLYVRNRQAGDSHTSYNAWKQIAFISDIPTSLPANGGTADFANKLATPRTIWGQSFDGSSNISGDMSGVGKVFINGLGDATLKIYQSEGVDPSCGQETINLQTCFDRQDGETHSYVTNYGYRCALALQPRGGNVGIGTTSPSCKLDVVGNAKITSSTRYALEINSAVDSAIITFKGSDGKEKGQFGRGEGLYGFSYEAYRNNSNSITAFGIDDSGNFFLGTGGNPNVSNSKVVALANGNVGINTTTPSKKLTVNGNALLKELTIDAGYVTAHTPSTAGWYTVARVSGYFNFDIYISGGWNHGMPSTIRANICNINGTSYIVQLAGYAGGHCGALRLGRVSTDTYDVQVYIQAMSGSIGDQVCSFVGYGGLTTYATSTISTTTYSVVNELAFKTISGRYYTETEADNRYLQLSGGTIENSSFGYHLSLIRTNSNKGVGIHFGNSVDGNLGYILMGGSGSSFGTGLFYRNASDVYYALLHSGNYNSYSPTLTGGGASGTWGINVTGSAGSATYSTYLHMWTSIKAETDIVEDGLRAYYGCGSGWTGSVTSMAYAGIIALGTPSRGFQMWARRGTGNTGSLYFRVGNTDANAWETERIILDSVNWASYISIPTVTNYYWANIPISATSNSGTSPTFANATTTGLLTVSSSNTHKGIKIGNTYINAIDKDVIFQNNSSIRFGGDDWDWNVWAGLKYVHSSKTISLGLADGTHFTANNTQSGGTMQFPGINKFLLNGVVHVKSGSPGQFDDGVRLYGSAKSSAWSNINFGCDPSTTSGTHENQWMIGRNSANNFMIGAGSTYANTQFELAPNGASTFRNTVNIRAVNPGNYTEGIRLYGSAKDSTYSIIAFGCDPAVTSGTHTNQWLIGRDSSNRFEIRNNSTSLLYILSSGNVGIGITSPTEKLHINGNFKIQGTSNTSTKPDIYLGYYTSWQGSTYPTLMSGYTSKWIMHFNPHIARSDSSDMPGANVRMESTGGNYYDLSAAYDGNNYFRIRYNNNRDLITVTNVGYLYTRGNAYIGDGNDTKELYIQGSTSSLRLFAWNNSTYIESGNKDFSANVPLYITGISGGNGSSIYLNFNNVYCRNGYTNIDSGNISSQSVNYANSCGNADTVDNMHAYNFGYNKNSDNYDCNEVGTHFAAYRFSGSPSNAFPSSAYGNMLVIGADSDTCAQLGFPYYDDDFYFRTGTWYSNGTGSIRSNAWKKIIHSGNIGSQSVNYANTANYATSAGNADTVDNKHASDFVLKTDAKIYRWSSTIKGQTWSRLYTGDNDSVLHHSSMFSISGSIGCVVFSQTFLVVGNHGYNAKIIQLNGGSYTQCQMRALVSSSGTVLIDMYWAGNDCSNSTSTNTMTINVNAFCFAGGITPTTSFTSDATIPSGYSDTGTINTRSNCMVLHEVYAYNNIYASHFYETSDINFKENIKAILNSDNIPVIKEFDWKSDGTHSYGLIAQELEEQGYSELVSDSGSHKTVNYSAALSLIVGKLQIKIKELEKEIEILKTKNNYGLE